MNIILLNGIEAGLVFGFRRETSMPSPIVGLHHVTAIASDPATAPSRSPDFVRRERIILNRSWARCHLGNRDQLLWG
jgi:hypothetical protein